MGRRSASVRINLEKREIEIHGSEQFVASQIDRLRDMLPSESFDTEKTSALREYDRKNSPAKLWSQSDSNRAHKGRPHANESKETDVQLGDSEHTLPDNPRALYEMWRRRINNGYISKHLLTTALAFCHQRKNENKQFGAPELRELYGEIGTTADVQDHLRKAHAKHLVRIVSDQGDKKSYEITPLGREKLKQCFTE